MENCYKIGSFSDNPLSLSGWIKWNEQKWNVTAEHVVYQKNGKEYPKLEGIIYRNKRGKIVMPLRNPYLPFEFVDTTDKNTRLYTDYQDVMGLFINDLNKYGISNRIILPPGFIDARPFQWAGFPVELRYTFLQNILIEYLISSSVKKKISKSIKLGYYVERSDDWASILSCLLGTEKEKKFSHQLSIDDIQNCAKLLGEDVIHGYLVRDKDKKPVSGGIRFVQKNGIAIGWVQGSIREYLQDGIAQLMYEFVIQDLKNSGASFFDWSGANIPAVALAKSAWGVPLTPQLMIIEKSLKGVLYNYFKPKVKKMLGKS